MTALDRAAVDRIVEAARQASEIPDLRSADLRAANLRSADLRSADLSDADLGYADLSAANLRSADLGYADLSDADLRSADLSAANLRYADLRDADLSDANLRSADLRGCSPMVIPLATPSGDGWLCATPHGWRVSIGCWKHHTLEDLRDLIEDRVEWPESRGEERERRRPALAAVLALAEAHAAYRHDVVPALAERWGVAS